MADDDVPILIVDDREENLVAVESVLAPLGYDLVTARSGVDALRVLLDRDFAAILVDVRMPGMDGFELVTLIKQRPRTCHTPIIFLTAEAPDLAHIYRGYEVGAVDYMTKPLDVDVLRAKIGIFAELFRKDRQLHAQAEALREAERRESQQRYRNLAEAIPHIVWTADARGTITYVNRRWAELTGVAAGPSWISQVHGEDRERVQAAWRDGIAAHPPKVFELECRLRGKAGSSRWHLCRAVPELDGDKLVGWLGTLTDFDDLHRAYEAAERAIAARDEFLSIASHELRTPLTTLQLRLQTLKTDVMRQPHRDETERRLESSLRQGRRLISLVDSLLDVSRITNGRIVLQPEPFDLVAATEELVQRFSEAAAIANVSVALAHDGPIAGTWDRLRVEQIIENLVTNAIKYASNAPVDVTLASAGDRVVITVRDRGPGIAPADRERIFGAFERAVSARNFGGLGLGLFIARQNAVAHGGTISVASELGVGTTFTVELPASVDVDAAETATGT